MGTGPRPAPPPSGLRKTAILAVLLGEEVSGQLFRHLTKREVARIAREIAQLGPIEPELAESVLEEYYLAAVSGPQERGGPEVARRLLAQASISEDIVDRLLGHDVDDPDDVLGPLLEAPPDVLARALQDEHPQTTALVLLHLPPHRAAQLLGALPEKSRAETVLRMATLKQVRGEVLGEVATSLHERLTDQRGQETGDGLARTVTVLAAMARIDTKRVLDQLDEEHPEEVARLRAELFTFESLVLADDRGLQELLRQVDSAGLALALVGADEKLRGRFLGNLSERAATMLKEEMEFLGTPNAKDQAAARKSILDLALKLEAEGNLVFAEARPGGANA
jgi:flagellar motor switch protein FliG